MYLLLDECCGKALGRFAESLGHTAQRSVDVQVLGKGASDAQLFDFARKAGAVLVTVNRADFIALAGTSASHPGVLLIPSLPNAELRPHFEKLLKVAEPLLTATPGLCVEVDTHGVVTSFTVP
jgi:predicted nuclease of predicted toxin-antitoxin system